ncbi:MAG: sigma-70 family RNA polymerase sigma factor [Gemmataceae bacterium]|nr:sigma-70 family RNA polymerase sigma factor [Gemmataceae bacterium]
MTLPVTRVFKEIRQRLDAQAAGELTDFQLLERFVQQRDEQAFAVVVRRHGPTVLGVCRRVLGNFHDAEDAFQATFLVLARKAGAVRWHESVGGWLFSVAYHLALKMKMLANRRRTETTVPEPIAPIADPESAEIRAILDEELNRLPEKYRAALVLCHYEGRTRSEAAQQLGWKPGAVKIRLERARDLLKTRLARRGLALSAIVAALESGGASAALSQAVLNTTVAAACAFAAGDLTAAGAASETVALLAQGALKTMMYARIQIIALVALLVGMLGTGAGLWTLQARIEASPPDQPALIVAPAAPKKPPEVEIEMPVRVLLVSSGPAKEYQFLRRLLANETHKKRVELSIYLQTAQKGAVLDVPAERLLREFPFALEYDDGKHKAEDRFHYLSMYDLVIAIDADWTAVPVESLRLLEKWVKDQKGGLVFIAGPMHTFPLARAANKDRLKPMIDLLPVVLDDSRLIMDRARDRPAALTFPGARAEMEFLKLDPDAKHPLAGWSQFFWNKPPDEVKPEDPVQRGLFQYYPVKRIKNGTAVIASYRDPDMRFTDEARIQQYQPFLAAMPYGKGKSFYVSSGELWRLRLYNEGYWERFWLGLTRFAVSQKPPRIDNRAELKAKPDLGKTVAKGLDHLVGTQRRDGHWEAKDGAHPVATTALAGLALLMEGSTLNQGKYQDAIRKAVEWLMEHRQDNGLIGKPNDPAEKHDYLVGHGFAMLFLASVYGEEEDQERRKKLETVLQRAADYTGRSQQPNGGWDRVGRVDGKERADILPTVYQCQALRAVRNAGIVVPGTVYNNGVLYLAINLPVENREPLAWAALAGVFSAGDYDHAVARRWLSTARKRSPRLDAPTKDFDEECLTAYHAQALYSLGDDTYDKLFPGTKPADRLTWSAYRKLAFQHLIDSQKADGSWTHPLGSSFGNALYLTILQLDNAVVPIYQR